MTPKVMSALACVLDTDSVSQGCELESSGAPEKSRCHHCRPFKEACKAKVCSSKVRCWQASGICEKARHNCESRTIGLSSKLMLTLGDTSEALDPEFYKAADAD